MKGFKKIFIILTMISSMFVLLPKLSASSAYISVYTSRNSLIVGNTFDVTVTISGDNLGSWDYAINYDSSKLSLVSGKEHVIDRVEYKGQSSASYYYTFKAIASGSSTVTVRNPAAADFDEQWMSVSNGYEIITAITQADLEASYSKNNNLKSLNVEGATLSPEFNADTLEYSVSVPSETTKIIINGEVEDSYASANGFGEFEVSEGENKFDIVVTAQNGGTKTYKVKINVEDNNPIEVSIDGLLYTVVKRASSLKVPSSSYVSKTIKINNQDVPVYFSEITNYTLVGLKDKEGNIDLFIYDDKKNSYKLYKELKTNSVLLYITDTKEVPNLYKKTMIKLNDEEVVAYSYENNKEYYILHGVNIETNEEGFYLYDVNNNTIVKYDDSIIEDLLQRNHNYLLIIIILGSETLVVTLLLLISITINSRRKKRFAKEYEYRKKQREIKEDIKKENEVNNILDNDKEKDLQSNMK